MALEQMSLPFLTMTSGGITYKLFGVVTNLDWDGSDVIRFHDGRCGKCEEAHKMLKEDFGGGKMPSSEIGANAAWWQIADEPCVGDEANSAGWSVGEASD